MITSLFCSEWAGVPSLWSSLQPASGSEFRRRDRTQGNPPLHQQQRCMDPVPRNHRNIPGHSSTFRLSTWQAATGLFSGRRFQVRSGTSLFPFQKEKRINGRIQFSCDVERQHDRGNEHSVLDSVDRLSRYANAFCQSRLGETPACPRLLDPVSEYHHRLRRCRSDPIRSI